MFCSDMHWGCGRPVQFVSVEGLFESPPDPRSQWYLVARRSPVWSAVTSSPSCASWTNRPKGTGHRLTNRVRPTYRTSSSKSFQNPMIFFQMIFGFCFPFSLGCFFRVLDVFGFELPAPGWRPWCRRRAECKRCAPRRCLGAVNSQLKKNVRLLKIGIQPHVFMVFLISFRYILFQKCHPLTTARTESMKCPRKEYPLSKSNFICNVIIT